jgi:rhodanese-related sulfurtransferase
MSLGGLFARLQGDAVPTIEHDDFVRAAESKSCAILDVREPHEYAAGHVPGAINLPLSRFSPAQLPQGRPIVLICLGGGRSARALRQALDAGWRDICHYAPGSSGWKSRGGALVA